MIGLAVVGRRERYLRGCCLWGGRGAVAATVDQDREASCGGQESVSLRHCRFRLMYEELAMRGEEIELQRGSF